MNEVIESSPSPDAVSSGEPPYSYAFDRELASEAVVSAVAAATARDGLSLPPLYDSVDPDALDAVVATADAVVSFRFAGHSITVESGTVHVEP